MALNIGKEITALKRMTVPDLRRKYAEVFGERIRRIRNCLCRDAARGLRRFVSTSNPQPSMFSPTIL